MRQEVIAGVHSSKRLGVTLAALSGAAALWFVVVTPIRTTAVETVNGTSRVVGHGSEPFLVVLSVLQGLAAVCTIAAAVLLATGKLTWARRLLLAGAVLGLNVVPVTTGLALASFLVIRRMPDSR